ncbi:MAG: hypothetical protein DBX97_23210 [Collinsella tanakaei]|nr:MAG: hypothetical protein DBX97_23210 [Collinsella tanakaei]
MVLVLLVLLWLGELLLLLICKYLNKTFIILEHLDLWLLKMFLIMMLVMKFVDSLNLMLGVLKEK